MSEKKKAIIWDAHGCFALRPTAELAELKRYKDIGVDYLSINVGMDFNSQGLIMEVIAGFRHYIQTHEDYMLAENLSSIEQARSKKKMCVAFDLEGSVMLADNPNMVELFYALGVRQMHLAYNNDNSVAGGCAGENIGISKLGREVIKEINRVGMVLDLSHMGERSTLEAMDLTSKPPVFSHSNVKALKDHPRNITDEQIKKCAQRKGVIGVNGIGVFLDSPAQISSAKIAEHIDYIVQLVGPEHVGIGLDYVVDKEEIKEYIESHPEVFGKMESSKGDLLMYGSPEQFPEIREELTLKGYKAGDIDLIFGENFYRIAKENWPQ